MSEEFWTALHGVVSRVLTLAAGDSQLRAELARLGRSLVTIEVDTPPQNQGLSEGTAVVVPCVEPDQLPSSGVVATHKPSGESPQVMESPSDSIVLESRPAAGKIEIPVGWGRWLTAAEVDLALLETRCRIKAEGARWAAARLRRLHEGADFHTEIEPKDREIIEKAKRVPDCFLWTNHPSGPSPNDLTLLEDVAGCFETVAEGLSLVCEVHDHLNGNRDVFEQCLDLVAEAQSALRVAIETVEGPRDNDQQKVFEWLRATAAEHQVFIRRFMRMDDPADRTAWADINERIQQVNARLQDSRQRDKQRQAWMSRVRYHVKLIHAGGREHDWRRVVETVEELMTDGMPPSNSQLRELLLPLVDDLPDLDDVGPGFQLVLRELDHYLASQTPSPGEVVEQPSTEVVRAAKLLRGRGAVLIGGDRRPYAQESLKAAFGLEELIWLDTREHQSIDGFEPYVARPDVAVVLLAIRWSSHSFGEVKDFCDRHGKLLVRLPGGYNPNQVAFQILHQCGDRLGVVHG